MHCLEWGVWIVKGVGCQAHFYKERRSVHNRSQMKSRAKQSPVPACAKVQGDLPF